MTDTTRPDAFTYKTYLKKTQGYAKRLSELALKKDYATPESALSVIGDTSYQKSIQTLAQKLGKVKQVVLIGIGGSSLGTEAIYAALRSKKSPALTVFDSIDSEKIATFTATVASLRSLKEIAVVIVSKSGQTTETLVNANAVLTQLEQRFGGANVAKRVVCIGDKGTPFNTSATKLKFAFIPLPHAIGGRYSVFTAVGMLPLTLLGIDTEALLSGARNALTAEVCGASAKHAARVAAHAEEGVRIVNFFTFDARLERVGYWYRQLLAESVGKATTKKDAPFARALVPLVSTSIDLHSVAQLYLSGSPHIFTHFVASKSTTSATKKSSPLHPIAAHAPFIATHNTEAIRTAIRTGVLQAYDDQKLPYRVSELDAIDAHAIGFLLASLMTEVMCIAHALDVNAFDQPSVELYKQHTRTALG